MTWRGDQKLSRTFILILLSIAIFIGDIFPVWVDRLEGKNAGTPGVKESMFANPSMFFGTFFFYSLLAVFFWWLYRKLHWLIMFILAVVIGTAMDFLVFKPHETGGPNVAENPPGVVFFAIVWPILLVAPYGIFQLLSKVSDRLNWSTKMKRIVTASVIAATIALIVFVEFKIR